MKTRRLIAAAIGLFMGFAAQAQFTPSTNPESIAGFSSGGYHTFNDCRSFRNCASCPLLMANAVGWHGSAPGVYWEVPLLGFSGTIPLPAGSNFGDVAFSTATNQTNLFMNVVYSTTSGFVFESYKWTGTTFLLSGSASWANVGSSTTGLIRIDATRNGDYAISVNFSNGSVSIGGGTNASLPAPPALVPALGAGTAAQTDVCLNSKPFPIATSNLHITFTDLSSQKIYTAQAPFSTMAIGPVTGIVGFVPGTVYYELRIASPITNAPSCAGTEIFSVIYNEVTATYYHEHQWNQDASGITNAVLTGGAAGYPIPAIQYSKRPGITYNEFNSFSSGVSTPCTGATICGWVSAGTASSMIGEKTQSNGTISGPVTYYEITNPARMSCDNIAFSSKYAGDQVLISYLDGSTVIYKVINWTALTMKSGHNVAISGSSEKAINVYPNPVAGQLFVDAANFGPNAQLHVRICDVTGRVSWSYNGAPENLQSGANSWLGSATPGIYYMKLADNENFNQTIKLVKQ